MADNSFYRGAPDASFYRVDTPSMVHNGSHIQSPSTSSLSHANDPFIYSPQPMPLNPPQTMMGSMSMSHINTKRNHYHTKPKKIQSPKQHRYYGHYHYDNINEETDKYPNDEFQTQPQFHQSFHTHTNQPTSPSSPSYSHQSYNSYHSYHQSFNNTNTNTNTNKKYLQKQLSNDSNNSNNSNNNN
eukprot:147861_1